MKSTKLRFFYGLVIFVTVLFSLHAADDRLRCSQCNRLIRSGRTYYKYKGKIFCSQKCQEKVLPSCTVCRKKIPAGVNYLVSQNKIYCSRECLGTIMPKCTICGKRSFNGGIYAADHTFFACPDCKELPRCFSCMIPVRSGQPLSDGRTICQQCRKTGITEMNQAEQIFHKVRLFMQEQFNIGTNHRIEFSLIDQKQLHHLSQKAYKSPGSQEQGLFQFSALITETTKGPVYNRKTTRKKIDPKYRIFILDNMPRHRTESVMAHELAHDWMSEYYPAIRDNRIREGVAQYASWLYNRTKNHQKYRELNIQIETNKDPVYGDGFRKIQKIAREKGMSGLKQYLRKQQQRNSQDE